MPYGALEAISTGILPRICSGFSGCQVTRMARASNARCFSPELKCRRLARTRAQWLRSAATSPCEVYCVPQVDGFPLLQLFLTSRKGLAEEGDVPSQRPARL